MALSRAAKVSVFTLPHGPKNFWKIRNPLRTQTMELCDNR